MAGQALRRCERALLNFEKAVDAYAKEDVKKLGEHLSSSSEEEGEEKQRQEGKGR